jgi:hypothetical protein
VIFLKDESFYSDVNMSECYQRYKKSLGLKHQNIANLLAMRMKTTKDVCSSM